MPFKFRTRWNKILWGFDIKDAQKTPNDYKYLRIFKPEVTNIHFVLCNKAVMTRIWYSYYTTRWLSYSILSFCLQRIDFTGVVYRWPPTDQTAYIIHSLPSTYMYCNRLLGDRYVAFWIPTTAAKTIYELITWRWQIVEGVSASRPRNLFIYCMADNTVNMVINYVTGQPQTNWEFNVVLRKLASKMNYKIVSFERFYLSVL